MYEYINKIVNLQKYELNNHVQNIEMFIYSVSCFFIPFFIGHPQWMVGIIVNSLLVLSALNLQKRRLLPIILLPSLGALARGMLFGPSTIFLLYFVPFIWIGNTILVVGFKHLHLHKKSNYFATLITYSALKALFLFIVALVFYRIGLVPGIFLTAMGIMQFITAVSGGFLAFVANRIRFIQAQP